MTPVERLQAAIEKLEQMRDFDDTGAWVVDVSNSIVDADGNVVAADLTERDATVIITLHRTIDAQLALFREALEFSENSQAIGMGHDELEEYYGNVRALADAILGGDS